MGLGGGPDVAEVDEAKKENTPVIADHTGSGLVAARFDRVGPSACR